ncbi:MAG: sugar phosphate isomerase/epimerase [Bryobacterales bacterium]|nr:sugar phosphate isomerase/epimerase [Bryobacterales bacterium]
MLSRRVFIQLIPGAVTAAEAAQSSRVQGVKIGVQSYSFRDRPLDDAILGMQEVGLTFCELWQGHVEPTGIHNRMRRDELRMWRKTVSIDHFREVRTKFRKAGIELVAYNYSFREDFDDDEIERGFEFAKALGVKCITASSNVSTAKRIDKYAKRARIRVGMHNHSRVLDNEFATPESFAKAREGNSPYIAINLDIGHFTAAGLDPVEFIERNHEAIVALHLKDRKKDQGENVPFVEGDTKIREVLHLLRDRKYPIPANIEYEYKGVETVSEVKKCYEYCRTSLEC